MVRTAKAGTHFRRGLDYLIPAVESGRVQYTWWIGGPVPDGAPAYAVNRDVPDINAVIRDGMFCAAVPNLIRRVNHKIVPTNGNALYDGGIGAYFGDSASREGSFGPGYFAGWWTRFDPIQARQWAANSRSGVLIGRRYRDVRDQGHVAVVLPSGYVLQCYPNPNGPDLNWSYTVEESHAGYYYELMIHPINWINHDKGGF